MTEADKLKHRIFVLPWMSIMLGAILLTALLDWLFISSIYGPTQGHNFLIVLPVILTLGGFFFWISGNLYLLFKGRRRLQELYAYLGIGLAALPSIMLHLHLISTMGRTLEVATVNDIRLAKPARWYVIRDFYYNPSKWGTSSLVDIDINRGRRSNRERRNYTVHGFIVSPLRVNDHDTAGWGAGAWLAYTKSKYLGQAPDYTTVSFNERMFPLDMRYEFMGQDPVGILYFERLYRGCWGYGAYNHAIMQLDPSFTLEPILLYPVRAKDESANYLQWAWLSAIVCSVVWLSMIMAAPVIEKNPT